MSLPTTTGSRNSLAPKADNKPVSFSSFINGKIGQSLVGNAISDPNRKARFVTSLITLVAMNPSLKDCEQSTIVSAALQAESLDLPLNNQLGFDYVVPFKDTKNNRIVAQFQIGWKGMVQLAIRSNQMKKIHAIEVRAGELVRFNPIINDFEFSYLTNPEERKNAPVIGYYAFFETTNGYIQELYWTKEEMEYHALEYSQAYKSDKAKGWKNSFWTKDFDEMSKKTMLKQVLKFAPMSVDSPLAKAILADQAVIEGSGDDATYDYVDNPDEAVESETPKIPPQVDADGVVTKGEEKKENIPAEPTPKEDAPVDLGDEFGK